MILLQIGSEIDINAKLLCKQYNQQGSPKNIDDYKNVIIGNEADFCNTEVSIIQHCNVPSFRPWDSWIQGDNPDWWKVYNKVKHQRFQQGDIAGIQKKYFKFANLKYTLFALGGLYQLLIYCYFNLSNGTRNGVNTPIPGSRLFELTNNKWDNITFYQDVVFHIDNEGNLVYKMGIY